MSSRLAVITFIDGGPVDPGFGNIGGGPRPDQGLPGGGGGYPSHPIHHPGYPSQGLPPFPSQGLPGGGGYPSQGLPGGSGGHPSHPIALPPPTPDNTLPPNEASRPPSISLPIVLPPGQTVDPDRRFELKYSPVYGWVLVPVDDDDEAAPKTGQTPGGQGTQRR